MNYTFKDYIVPLFLLTGIGIIFFSTTALEFYVAVKKPSRLNLENFSRILPQILSKIYFNQRSAVIYDGSSKIDSIDYLLQKRRIHVILIKWFLGIMLFVGVILINFIRQYHAVPKERNILIIFTMVAILIFARISRFGSKIISNQDIE